MEGIRAPLLEKVYTKSLEWVDEERPIRPLQKNIKKKKIGQQFTERFFSQRNVKKYF